MLDPELRERLLAFRRERDWEQFHDLRTLSVSLALECAELLELTQWAREAELPRIEREQRARIEEELADIAILLSYLAHDQRIDLNEAVRHKLETNAAKYPVDKSRGVATKYDRL